MKIEPYLFFAGRCDEAIAFYKSAVGAEVTMLMRYNQSPEPAPPGMLPPGSENKVMHASMKIGDATVMAADGCNGGNPKFDGFSLRVPTPTVSIVDFVVETEQDVTVESVNAAFKAASESDAMRGILGYSEEPLVSSDLRQDPRSSIIDALSTMVIGNNLVKVIAWYDNEWGYSCRVADLAALVCEAGIPGTA